MSVLRISRILTLIDILFFDPKLCISTIILELLNDYIISLFTTITYDLLESEIVQITSTYRTKGFRNQIIYECGSKVSNNLHWPSCSFILGATSTVRVYINWGSSSYRFQGRHQLASVPLSRFQILC